MSEMLPLQCLWHSEGIEKKDTCTALGRTKCLVRVGKYLINSVSAYHLYFNALASVSSPMSVPHYA